jgi:5-methylcytosine-specific restriction endonuclease McrA
MEDWIDIRKDEKHIKREREKAKKLKKTQWWQNKLNAGICYFCGKKFPRDELTMDHLVPVSRGGKSTKSNIVVSCKNCNSEKKYLTPVDMILRKLKDDQKNK